jgi:hypothetical protein
LEKKSIIQKLIEIPAWDSSICSIGMDPISNTILEEE